MYIIIWDGEIRMMYNLHLLSKKTLSHQPKRIMGDENIRLNEILNEQKFEL